MNFALALLTAAALAACGGTGSSGGDQTHKVAFTQQVTFGDSLSDVGTYNVGAIAAGGGGKFTINGNNTGTNAALTGKNWTEVLAAELNLPAPCAAQTGLNGADNADPAADFRVAVVNNVNCFNYAQGGARVSDPTGPGNAAVKPDLGELTVPVKTQIANHLANPKVNGKFSGTELVTVMAGGNDVLMLLGGLNSAATAAGNAEGQKAFATSLTMQLAAGASDPAAAAAAIGRAIMLESARAGSTPTTIVQAAVGAAYAAGNIAAASPAVYGPMVATAQAAAGTAGLAAGAKFAETEGPKLVGVMAGFGAELATLVKEQIVAKGANYVVVNNLPDVASTPSGKAQSASTQKLIGAMVDAFNAQLKAGLGNDPKIAYVDLYAISKDQVVNPAIYGLTNTTQKACTTESSLTCTIKTLSAPDVSHYMFADDIHPTPYEYWLVTRYVLKDMAVKGWL
jgi:phospholipase/lecithinase/hemolysin